MSETIIITKVNNVFLHIECSEEQSRELYSQLSCYIENHFFHPLVKRKLWDGRISFFNNKDQTVAIGLLPQLLKFCEDNNYQYKFDFDISTLYNDIPDDQLKLFYDMLFKDKEIYPRDYQQKAIKKALSNKRAVLLSPTGSGKSAIVYCMVRFLLAMKKHVLIVVPTTNLVEQLYTDFISYGWEATPDFCCRLHGSRDYDETKPILISTWQSLLRKQAYFFDRFNGMIVDECLHPDTLITMADGSQKAIKYIVAGEFVMSKNLETGKDEPKEVLKTYENLSNPKNNFYELNDGKNKLQGTGNHPIIVNGKRKRLDSLTKKDKVINY